MGRTELLDRAVDAHGGVRRWEEITRFRVAASITGTIWAMKGKPGLLDNVVFEGETKHQRLKITPFPKADRFATWEPGRVTIQAGDGAVVDERRDPTSSFAGHTRQTPWDLFQVVCFASEANWNYLVAPFVFTRADFDATEVQPWHEDGEVWRSLRVTYPEGFLAHSRQQTYYFDDAALLRRLDYTVDILGSGPAVHYPAEYREFNGIMVPTRRRVYVRNPDGSPARESVSIAIDITDVAFS